ncbi:hypothetical protein G8764_16765 [Pseudomaricurvus alcaniphilus]|uniref:hypothetical protein n=1 Tax=Pseudomaricurvus alcaniphilus TaxID=1166482 RepID=UPI00140A3BB4|nr:hypothetical protein [Pseudomaricurvus alcaniphilus]NHN38963.1 hypothetical protein [Pseudomaricurvus alcaniphilus]
MCNYEDTVQDAIDMVSAWDSFDTDEEFFAAVRDQAMLMQGLAIDDTSTSISFHHR